MGLLDSVIGSAMGGGGQGGLSPEVLMNVVSTLMNEEGGLSGLIQKFQAGGLGEIIQSWIGSGANLPISGDQLSGVLGGDLMGKLADQMGTGQEQAAGTLAGVLPGLVDQLSPDGGVPADNGLGGLGALLGGGGGLGGMLGGMLKG
ncbi:YidB family protein [Hydrogenophaga sp. 5NK40-0174]|uniref:YidB family protein n=1 Tax=Hydrogenophaga sp. 5NK40-0174 TaxID=3127649 RepID=UPI003104628C